jgi:hypothetical protein
MKIRDIRLSQLTQIVAPLIAALVSATIIGHLAGNAWLQLTGRAYGWYWGTVRWMAPLLAIALLIAIVGAAIVVGQPPAPRIYAASRS